MTSLNKLIYLEDRSGAELDDKCGMAYWWNRKAGPKRMGIVPKVQALPLAIGSQTHEDLLLAAQMEDISSTSVHAVVQSVLDGLTDEDKDVTNTKRMELLYRRLGWFVAFCLFMEPALREKYENVFLEGELILNRDPLWVPVTPDRVLRNKQTGVLEYREYKTTISASKKWLDSWQYAIQLHIGLKAISEELEKECKFAHIMGLMKGTESFTDHRLMHPYVWGYYNHQRNEWGHEYDKCRGNDWVPMPVWEFEGGLVQWVQRLGPSVARAQFPLSPPVFLNERHLDKWIVRRTARQKSIKIVEDACYDDPILREKFFESKTKNCKPAFGDACPYLAACWNAEVERDPLKNGDYVVRIPHHDTEIIGLDF